MTVIRSLLVVALSALVIGCGTDPKNLQAVDSSMTIELASDYEFVKQYHGLSQENTMKYTLAQGTYVAVGKNSEGTYFKGPPSCFRYQYTASSDSKRDLTTVTGEDGGIFVPFRSDKPAVMFRISGSSRLMDASQQRGGVIAVVAPPGTSVGQGVAGGVLGGLAVNAMVGAERGNLLRTPYPEDNSLRSTLVFRPKQ